MQLEIPQHWMPPARMRRIVAHWTAGSYLPADHDLESYHLLITGDGQLVRGKWPVNANERIAAGQTNYAAHVARLNTGSIGVALCGMWNATQSPFRPGRFPITQQQWQCLADVLAQLCQRYSIPLTPTTVLTHGEVEPRLGVPQMGKWEFLLPWQPSATVLAAGDEMRRLTSEAWARRNAFSAKPKTEQTK